MLLRTDAIATNFGLAMTDTVWRWLGESADVLGSGQIVLGMFADLASAQLYDARDAQGNLLPVGPGPADRKIPLGELRVPVAGAQFAAMIARDYPGSNLSERLTAAIYATVRLLDPDFANAQDV